MKIIHNITSFSTGIYSEYSSVNSIEYEVNEIGGGNFGVVYPCVSINNRCPPLKQVIKIFKDNNGSAQRGFETIKALQKNLQGKIQQLKNKGKNFETEYPGLLACPQFSFIGKSDGQQVIGYSANDLNALGFESFETLTNDVSYYVNSTPIEKRLNIAYHLANSFELLRNLWYIHADLKADALFVHKTKGQCAIIDYDSGAVMQSDEDQPTTWGTPQDWLAPEIIRQYEYGLMKRKNANDVIPVNVNLQSDMWSVAIGIHYLIFGINPFTFLTQITHNNLQELVRLGVALPDIPTNLNCFRYKTDNLILLKWYQVVFKQVISESLQKKFQCTFSEGCIKPNLRASYTQWKTILKKIEKLPYKPEFRFIPNQKKVIVSPSNTKKPKMKIRPFRNKKHES